MGGAEPMAEYLPYITLTLTIAVLLLGAGVWKGQRESADAHQDKLEARYHEKFKELNSLVQKCLMDIAVLNARLERRQKTRDDVDG